MIPPTSDRHRSRVPPIGRTCSLLHHTVFFLPVHVSEGIKTDSTLYQGSADPLWMMRYDGKDPTLMVNTALPNNRDVSGITDPWPIESVPSMCTRLVSLCLFVSRSNVTNLLLLSFSLGFRHTEEGKGGRRYPARRMYKQFFDSVGYETKTGRDR